MPESNTVSKQNGQRARNPSTQVGFALQQAVLDQPWLMVGAATTAGLTVGLQSRRFLESHAFGTLLATLGAIAARAATNVLQEWIEAQRRL
jgi:CBS-domain-containing membrane protein